MSTDSIIRSSHASVSLAASSNSTDDGFATFSGTLNTPYVIAIAILSFIAAALLTVLFSIYYSVSTKKKQYALVARNNPDKPVQRLVPAPARSPAAPRPYPGQYVPRAAAPGTLPHQQIRAATPAAYPGSNSPRPVAQNRR